MPLVRWWVHSDWLSRWVLRRTEGKWGLGQLPL